MFWRQWCRQYGGTFVANTQLESAARDKRQTSRGMRVKRDTYYSTGYSSSIRVELFLARSTENKDEPYRKGPSVTPTVRVEGRVATQSTILE